MDLLVVTIDTARFDRFPGSQRVSVLTPVIVVGELLHGIRSQGRYERMPPARWPTWRGCSSRSKGSSRGFRMKGSTAVGLASTPRTLARMGGVYWGLGRFEDALQACLLGGVLLGSDAGSSYNEGLCLEKMGLYAEAIAAFERALTLQPELPRAREHIRALTQSLALGESGKE